MVKRIMIHAFYDYLLFCEIRHFFFLYFLFMFLCSVHKSDRGRHTTPQICCCSVVNNGLEYQQSTSAVVASHKSGALATNDLSVTYHWCRCFTVISHFEYATKLLISKQKCRLKNLKWQLLCNICEKIKCSKN